MRPILAALLAVAVTVAACHREPAPPVVVGDGSAAVEVAVDPRVELFSLLERLAGSPEYTRAATPYAVAADAWFAPVKDDAAVVAFRELRASHGISYDAALTLAVQLDAELQPVRALSPLPDGVDARWQGVDVADVLAKVRAFAATSRFDAFRASQAAYATAVEDRLRAYVAQRPLVHWFDTAFGVRSGARYRIAPGLLTGSMNYGLHATPLDITAVMFVEAPDASGLPTFGAISEELLAHELAHSYVNPIVHAHVAAVSAPSAVLDAAQPAMTRQHYTTREIVAEESLVRALTVLYLRDSASPAAANAALAEQTKLGFAWTPELVAALDAARARHGGAWSEGDLLAAFASVLTSRAAR